MPNKTVISYLLRAAVAFPFVYVPIAAYFNPDNWIWFVPDFMPKALFLNLFGIAEIGIALGLFFMENPFLPALAAIAALAPILLFDWYAFDIVFRDVSILLAAAALILLHRDSAIL